VAAGGASKPGSERAVLYAATTGDGPAEAARARFSLAPRLPNRRRGRRERQSARLARRPPRCDAVPEVLPEPQRRARRRRATFCQRVHPSPRDRRPGARRFAAHLASQRRRLNGAYSQRFAAHSAHTGVEWHAFPEPSARYRRLYQEPVGPARDRVSGTEAHGAHADGESPCRSSRRPKHTGSRGM
jgi:hypothetical protein